MEQEQVHRKRCKRNNHPCHGHALTFSCYRSRPFLNETSVCNKLAETLARACVRHDVALWGYVFMPEHVHLLVRPRQVEYSISTFLLAVKQPVARWVLRFHKQNQTQQLSQMATGQQKRPYQFWQAGGGYDRNIVSFDTALNTMKYIHQNPVRRKLVEHPADWYYSSYKDWNTNKTGPVEEVKHGQAELDRATRLDEFVCNVTHGQAELDRATLFDRLDMARKPIIGITGGIGSGKSTVAAEFGRFGCCVIDADAMVSKLLETEEIKRQIAESFGNEVFGESGAVDRGRLAEIVFGEKANVEKLNSIVHPPVLAQIEELIAEYDKSDARAIVLDMPLLVEVGWSKRCDKIIFVACDEQIRTQRMAQKCGFTKKQLKNREKFQILLDSKAEIADYIIGNSSGLTELSEQIVHIFTQIQI